MAVQFAGAGFKFASRFCVLQPTVTASLLEAVRAGRIIAALDVYDHEPLPANRPLRVAPNTMLTPHLGYGVKETWTQFYGQSLELAFLDGKPLRSTNPEAIGVI
jgi:phosphoglycerate dehydrogenase-like enzyme